MKVINLRYLIIGVVMLAAAGLAIALTPREKIADHGPKVDLETMIPKQFGEWRVDENMVPLQVSPDVKAKLNKIYNQTLSRTYVNGKGERVMLSIAYGSDQSDSMTVHKPEVCYPAQGFEVLKKENGVMSTPSGDIPVTRVLATQGKRVEPVTYWITIGEKVVLGQWSRKFEQMRHALTGKVPDGLLFRVSSISPDVPAAYRLQVDFVQTLLSGAGSEARRRLVGNGQS